MCIQPFVVIQSEFDGIIMIIVNAYGIIILGLGKVWKSYESFKIFFKKNSFFIWFPWNLDNL
jgi:hypothetical protein